MAAEGNDKQTESQAVMSRAYVSTQHSDIMTLSQQDYGEIINHNEKVIVIVLEIIISLCCIPLLLLLLH